MTNEMILTELNVLPEHLKVQVINYIRFLKSPFVVAIEPTHKKPKFGFGKYKVEISDDFDAPLDDFKDYMQ
jgi:Protein of unknown function (DUF2281)